MCLATAPIDSSLRSQPESPRPTLQRILHDNWQPFALQFPQPVFVHRAAFLLAHCRTALLGGHVERCEHGHVECVHYNSCRHRCCPGCSATPRASWLDKWESKMLDTSAMQVVFTLPSELAQLWRMNKQLIADVLFNSSKDSLLKLLADPQFLGAQPGLLAALHTWSQTLSAHPHVHFIVTVRAYGLYATGNGKRLEQARTQQARTQLDRPLLPKPDSTLDKSDKGDEEIKKQKRCPICNGSLVVEPLEFEEAVRPWNVYQAKRKGRGERAPPPMIPRIEKQSIA